MLRRTATITRIVYHPDCPYKGKRYRPVVEVQCDCGNVVNVCECCLVAGLINECQECHRLNQYRVVTPEED